MLQCCFNEFILFFSIILIQLIIIVSAFWSFSQNLGQSVDLIDCKCLCHFELLLNLSKQSMQLIFYVHHVFVFSIINNNSVFCFTFFTSFIRFSFGLHSVFFFFVYLIEFSTTHMINVKLYMLTMIFVFFCIHHHHFVCYWFFVVVDLYNVFQIQFNSHFLLYFCFCLFHIIG